MKPWNPLHSYLQIAHHAVVVSMGHRRFLEKGKYIHMNISGLIGWEKLLISFASLVWSDVITVQLSWSTSDRVMFFYLNAPSHYHCQYSGSNVPLRHKGNATNPKLQSMPAKQCGVAKQWPKQIFSSAPKDWIFRKCSNWSQGWWCMTCGKPNGTVRQMIGGARIQMNRMI